ncbi:MAG: DUF222 domain-containing protein, partial [Streptosporangiaceae bacterium]|nr:DUF222 domain-containing protein [Streptosporangiaceae bacterium]
GRLLAAFDAMDGAYEWGQRTWRSWAVNHLRVSRGQAGEYRELMRLCREFPVLAAALAEGCVLPRSMALLVARWLRSVPEEFRGEAEEIVVAAARNGADLAALARIIAEITARVARPDDDGGKNALPDRGVSLDTTFEGAGVLRGDLTAECAAMVQAVLDALAVPPGAGDPRTQAERYHDGLQEAMRRLLASSLLPQRAGAPVKAVVHIPLAALRGMDGASLLEDSWVAEARVQWVGRRAAASVASGDGGAWLDGDAARAVLCDAMAVPVVFGDVDVAALEQLITVCARYHKLRGRAGAAGVGSTGSARAADAAAGPDPFAVLEERILGLILDVVSGPGGAASFLRRTLLGKGLNGPSLPLDVGQTDEIPAHLRRLASLRDEGRCRFPGGCDQPAVRCECHHVRYREHGGHTSLNNLRMLCRFHHNVVIHRWGWRLTARPDGTGQVTSPGGRTIRSHSPPPRPG